MTEAAHPTLDQLSDHVEGLLPAAEDAAVTSHLAVCAGCQTAVDGLTGFPDLLQRAHTDPPAMPADVTARLTAAIERESAARSARTGVVSMEQRGRRRKERSGRGRIGRVLGIAASVAVVAGGSVIGYQVISQPEQSPTSGSAARENAAESAAKTQTYALRDTGTPITLRGNALEQDVRAALQPSSPGTEQPKGSPKPKKDFGEESLLGDVSVGACVAETVRGASKDPILDQADATFDRQRGVLAIIRGKDADTVRAIVVVGCPSRGRVAEDTSVKVTP